MLSFGLDRPVNHAKIKEVVNPGPKRWTHHVVVKEQPDLDDTLCEWLTEAYLFSGRAGRAEATQESTSIKCTSIKGGII